DRRTRPRPAARPPPRTAPARARGRVCCGAPGRCRGPPSADPWSAWGVASLRASELQSFRTSELSELPNENSERNGFVLLQHKPDPIETTPFRSWSRSHNRVAPNGVARKHGWVEPYACDDDLAYLRFPHLHGDLLCFAAEDDLWVAPLTASGGPPGRAW